MDLEAVYLPGLDIVTMQQLEGASGDVAALSARMDAVHAHLRLVDDAIGAAGKDAGPGAILVLVGERGGRRRRRGCWSFPAPR